MFKPIVYCYIFCFSGHKRAAVRYGSYDPFNRNNIGGMFNRRSGGWGSNSRFNGGWNQYGKLSYSPALQALFVFTYIPRITEKKTADN